MKHPRANQGQWLEKLLKAIVAGYEQRGIMTLKKVDPPTILIHGQWVRTPSPFLDFVGSWTERGGRAVFLECKTTRDGKLGLLDQGGITQNQYDALLDWHYAGAVSCVLWAAGSRIALVTASQLESHIERAREMKTPRRLSFDELEAKFSISEIYNFVTALRAIYDNEPSAEEGLPLFKQGKKEVGV